MGQNAEAREKYIQAVIAEPYNNNRSWMGLSQWCDRVKVKLNWVKLQDKSSVTRKDDKNINITLDPGSGESDPNNAPWTAYALERALWQGDKFKKGFPNETKYRRTMREEVDSLHMMVSVLDTKKKLDKLDAGLLQLAKIDQAGLLEPFALLNRANAEIAQDYAPYRAAHRDTLFRYFDEFVVPKSPPQEKDP